MISMWEVLKASKGLPVSDFYAAMWGRKMAVKYIVTELEGTLPMSIVSAGEPLIDYRIYGNTEQTGTPTPENPIMPIGCGELETTGAHTGQYKLPILSNSTVTNIYLGEVQTTRCVRKSIFDGTENWRTTMEANVHVFFIPNSQIPNNEILCTHYTVRNWSGLKNYDNSINVSYTYAPQSINVRMDTYNTVSDFKSFLAAQYAAGTPVTVWYVLEEPETGIVNEPLMKIGDYADTVSMEQAGVSIPTNNGSTVIDYDGTLKPSEMYIKYLGVKND